MSENAKTIKTDAPFNDDIQKHILDWLSREFAVAKRNMAPFHTAFQEYNDMIHCIRDKKNDYEPDIYLPEFAARLLTQIGNFVSQYFSSRDFVEARVNSDDPMDVAEGKASKKLLNILLGEKDAHYFHKLCRLLMFVNPGGFGIIKGGYDQQVEQIITGYNDVTEYARDDNGDLLAEDGVIYTDPYSQSPMSVVTPQPIYADKVVRDRPVFDVYPIQNVYYDQKYAYSMQDKEYVYFETEMTLDALMADQDRMGYFNLKRLKEMEKGPDAQEGDKPHSQEGTAEEPEVKVSPVYQILERWGKWPMIVTARDEQGKPIDYKPGMDKNGEINPEAENVEGILTYVCESTEKTPVELIRFQASPHSRRPMARFLCYIDAAKDSGFGDGETSKELQIAANDTFNLNAYRTEMATKLAFKGKRWATIDENINIRPDKVTFVENIDDLVQWEIKDDIQGGMYQLGVIANRMDDAMATGPNQRGMGGERRETATVGAIMDRRADIRMSLKTTTLEWVGFTEFYDMMLTLCNDFMLPQTLASILGPDMYAYNPDREDKFEPVSQALETEESKSFKVKMWDQILGRVVALQNAKTPMVVNYIIGQVLELMGGSFKHFKKFMFNEDIQANMLYQIAIGGKGQGQGSTPNAPGGPGQPQNQTGLPQSGLEQMTRGLM